MWDYLKGKCCLFIICLIIMATLLIACGETDCPTSTISVSPNGVDLTYNPQSIPAWTAGQFGSFQITANGGTPPYQWMCKEGSQLPAGFEISEDGVLFGTLPLLAGGTTQVITPPFSVIVTDAAGQQKGTQLRLTIIQKTPSETFLPFVSPTAAAPPEASAPVAEEYACTIESVNCEYVGVEWEGAEGVTTYRYTITASGTASGPVNTAIQVHVDIRGDSDSGRENDSMVSASSWTYEDKSYSCCRRTASDPAVTNWTFVQNILVTYWPSDPRWPTGDDISIEAKLLEGYEGGYSSLDRWTKSAAVAVIGPP